MAGIIIRQGENTLQAAASAVAAALSAATAEAASGPTYASTAAGLAATTSGEAFAVDAGGGLVSVYLNSSGTAVLQRTLATTGALAASSGAGLVGFSADTSYSAGTVGLQLKRLTDTIRFWGDFGIVADGSTDDTTAVQAALDWLSPGKILIMPGAKIKITATVQVGNGSTSQRSTLANNSTIIWGGESSNANTLIDTSDPWYATARSGTQFVWAGANGGTMFRVAGPIQGLRWVGAVTLDGASRSDGAGGAGACFEAKSFSSCTIDTIVAVNWQASGRGVLLTTVDDIGTTIGANSVLSGGNRIGRIFAYAPYGHNGECVKLDGYKVAGGQDITVSDIGTIQCGISGTGAKGLVLGYCDDITIGKLVNTTYGAIASAFGVFLVSSSTPFEVPARIYIYHAAVGQGVTVGGGSNAQVIIEHFEMDDAATLPSVTGLFIRNICKTGDTLNMMAYPSDGLNKTRADGNGHGWYGYDNSGNHIHSVTRQGVAAHIAGFGDIEFQAGATGGPTTAQQFKITTLRTVASVPQRVVPYTVGTLPSGAAGDRTMVTDANATTFNSIVAGGGANTVPVYHDGTNWRIG